MSDNSRISPIKDVVIAALREHLLFIAIVCSYCLAVQLLGYAYRVPGSIKFQLYSPDLLKYLTWFVGLYFMGHSIYVMIMIRPRRLLLYLFHDWRGSIFHSRRIASGLLVLLLLPIFLSAFSSLKSIIPVINPFLWDEPFAAVERTLHFGYQPWQLLQPILHRPLLSYSLNIIYNGWLWVLYVILFWQMFSLKDVQLRMQYFLSFLILWIVLGSIMGSCFASVGPCFYDFVVEGENPFSALMDYLRTANEQYPLWALSTQEALWAGYHLAEPTKGSGVSAMPSMHVAMATLFALLGIRTNKLLGIVMILFCGVIFIGSIHLSWHYAIDGYVSILMTVLVWKSVGWFMGRKESE